jgi:hypothetical protein
MSSEPREYLQHILVEADYLIAQSVGLTWDRFSTRMKREAARLNRGR